MIDAISVSAVFDQPTAVAFINEGVWQLFDQTTADRGKNTQKLLAALPTFDVKELMVERESLYQRNLILKFKNAQSGDEQTFLNAVEIKDRSAIRERMRDFDVVVTY